MTKARTEIRLAGSGGQGLITAGIILAEAAIYDRKNGGSKPILRSRSPGRSQQSGSHYFRRPPSIIRRQPGSTYCWPCPKRPVINTSMI